MGAELVVTKQFLREVGAATDAWYAMQDINVEWGRREHMYYSGRGPISRAQMRRKRENLRKSWPELAALLDKASVTAMDEFTLWDRLADAQWNHRRARQTLNWPSVVKWRRRMNFLERLIDIKGYR